ncbi:hypothetical protein GE061_003760 [Apolygus lucorum]|uniref:BTB domain-containing protein n=1 Tax=Apolygus lucorum TaxID=248454 RepID=A0A8S9X2Y4_APOLU|nr:hypothetical protein GE061_003760 [Apolygus lucorum]
MLRKWEVLKGVDGKQLEEIKFFHGFQTYTGDKQKRNSCAIFLTTNDEVFVVGHNNEDNLLALTGNDFGKQVVVKKPRKIEALSGKNIRKIVVNERFGTALTEDGKLLYWGTNMRQLQYEAHDPKYVSEPFEPNPDVRVADMACGAHSITLVTDENKVFIWGCINLYYSSFYQFEKIELRRDVQVKGISCGWGHVALLDQKGQVWTFGTGTVGQLGYAKDRGQLFDEIVPKKVSLPQPCTKVECGYYSTLYLLKNGELYASGSNGKSDHLCVGKSGYVFNPVKVLLDDSLSDIAATFAWSSGRWQSLYAAVSKDGMKYYEWGNDKKLEKPRISEGAQSIMEVFSNFKTPQSIGELVRVDVVQLQGPGIDPLGVGHAKAVYKPEKVKIDEKVVDVAASMRTNEFGGRISTFAVKTASGKIYKCEGGKEKPEELVNTKFLVEAFADEEIPQSLSLVRLLSDPDDEDLTDIELRGPISSGVTPEKTLFNDPLFSDVTIKLKDGVIASHKVLLHIKSQFFRKALSSNKVDDQEELDLVSYNSKAVRALLMHIYDLPIGQHATDLNDVIEFVNLAKEDGNPELILIAEDILLKNMVFSLYLAGDSNVPLPTSENTMKELRDFIESSVFPHGSNLS